MKMINVNYYFLDIEENLQLVTKFIYVLGTKERVLPPLYGGEKKSKGLFIR